MQLSFRDIFGLLTGLRISRAHNEIKSLKAVKFEIRIRWRETRRNSDISQINDDECIEQ